MILFFIFIYYLFFLYSIFTHNINIHVLWTALEEQKNSLIIKNGFSAQGEPNSGLSYVHV